MNKYESADVRIYKEARHEFYKRWASDMRKEKYFDLSSIVKFGKYKNKSIQEIVTQDPGYIRHCLSHIKWFKLAEDAIVALNKNAKSYTHFYSEEDYVAFAEKILAPEKHFNALEFFEETTDEKKRLLNADLKKLHPKDRLKLKILLAMNNVEKEHANAPFFDRSELMMSAKDKTKLHVLAVSAPRGPEHHF